jgi:hypothetical protein
MLRMRVLALLPLAFLVACGGENDVDATGDYTVSLTNRDNGCQLSNWNVGDTSSGIPLTIAQTDNAITATVGGGAGVALGLWLGDNHYTGEVSGSNLDLQLEGQNNMSQGTCDYHYISIIDGELHGDVIGGQVRYETVTDGSSDCGALEGCASIQDFNGTRPPT